MQPDCYNIDDNYSQLFGRLFLSETHLTSRIGKEDRFVTSRFPGIGAPDCLLSLKTHEFTPATRSRCVFFASSSLLIVHKGTGMLRCDNGDDYVLEPGVCLSMRGHVRFRIRTGECPGLKIALLQYGRIGGKGGGGRESVHAPPAVEYPSIERLEPSYAGRAEDLTARLASLGAEQGRSAALRRQMAFVELLLVLEERKERSAGDSGAFDDGAMQRTIDYMKRNYAEALSVGTLAGMAGLTPSSFSRAFRQITGQTPGSYLADLRISRAKELMMRSRAATFKEISGAVGFQDELYFSRVFKKREGVSPTLYMKRTEQRIAIISGLNLQDHLLALGIRPIAAPSFPRYYGSASGFPVYLERRLSRTVPIDAERTIASREITSLSPDCILKTDFIRNPNDEQWQGADGHLVFLQNHHDWESYQRDIAGQFDKDAEAERIIRGVKAAERHAERELRPFARHRRWTVVRLLPGDCRIYGRDGHAFTDLLFRDLKFQPDDGLEFRSYRSGGLESLIAHDPDNVLVIWSDPETTAGYMADPLWRELRAAREGRVHCPESTQWDPWGPIGREYTIRKMSKYFLSFRS